MFPGQGSQAVGMGVALAARYPEAQGVFDQASQVLVIRGVGRGLYKESRM